MDLATGDGLDAALAGVEAVVDTTNCTATDRDEAVAYFGATTRNLLTAEKRTVSATTCCSRSPTPTASKATRTTPASANRSAS